MTLQQILQLELINDNTQICIRDQEMRLVARGNWFQDNVLDYIDEELTSFTWQNDNKIYVDMVSKESEDDSINRYYGLPDVFVVSHGEWSDLEIIHNGKSYNFYDVDAMLSGVYELSDTKANFASMTDWVKDDLSMVYAVLQALDDVDACSYILE